MIFLETADFQRAGRAVDLAALVRHEHLIIVALFQRHLHRRRHRAAEQLFGVVQRIVNLLDVAGLEARAGHAVGHLRQQTEVGVIGVGDGVDEDGPILHLVAQLFERFGLGVGAGIVGVAVAVQGDAGQLIVLGQRRGQLHRLRDARQARDVDVLDLLLLLGVALHDVLNRPALEVDGAIALRRVGNQRHQQIVLAVLVERQQFDEGILEVSEIGVHRAGAIDDEDAVGERFRLGGWFRFLDFDAIDLVVGAFLAEQIVEDELGANVGVQSGGQHSRQTAFGRALTNLRRRLGGFGLGRGFRGLLATGRGTLACHVDLARLWDRDSCPVRTNPRFHVLTGMDRPDHSRRR